MLGMKGRTMKYQNSSNNSQPAIDFLITTVSRDNKAILDLIKKTNLSGSIIVGNQKSKTETVEHFCIDKAEVTIVNMKSIGTSINRNTLLQYCKNDFLTFWDDDSTMVSGAQEYVLAVLNKIKDFDAIRFNSQSLNNERPLKIIKRNKRIVFKDIKSLGVCGIFFKRDSIMEKHLLFRDDVGPGTVINHGEDTLFLLDFFKNKLSMFQDKKVLIDIDQNESCWYDKVSADDYYFSQGYLYNIIYPNTKFLHGFYHILKTKSRFKNSRLWNCMKYFKKGTNFKHEN